MKPINLFLLLAALSGLAFSVDTQCEIEQKACMRACCEECGEEAQASADGLLCGGHYPPPTECAEACSECSPAYWECTGQMPTGVANNDDVSFSCCGPAFILLALAGFVLMKR